MPRRAKVERRIPAPDARYQSEVLARFINKVMERGKKGTAERIVYGALDRIANRTGRAPLEVFEDRKSTRLNSSHANTSYAAFCLKKNTQSPPPPAPPPHV